MRKLLIKSLIVTCFVIGGITTMNAVTIVKNGQPLSVIVLAEKPTRSAQLAAREFQTHIKAISGADIAIVKENEKISGDPIPIYIGESVKTREMGLVSIHFAPQESMFRITDKYLAFIGRDDLDFGRITYEKNGTWPGFNHWKPFYRLGSLYGVYNFLEEFCGVRWYMVTDLGTVIPKKRTLTFEPAEKRSKPWTIYRNTSRNVWQIPGEVPVKDKRMKPCTKRDNNLFVLRCRLGGEPYSVCHSVCDYYKRFGEKHPDWFVDGKPGKHIQPRFDNPEVVAQIVEDAEDFFAIPYSQRKLGAKITQGASISAGHFFSVAPLDNRDFGRNLKPPLQPKRQKIGCFGNGVYSNYYFNLVNNVAKKVMKVYPDQWISSIAYAGMYEPPEFSLSPNIAVSVCNADGWEEGSYGLETLKAWRKKVSRIFMWEYYLEKQEQFPRFRPHTIARYLTHLADMGIDGWFSEMPSFYGKGVHRNPGLYHLNAYITYLMLRKKGINIDQVLDEYYKLFYGPAAKPMKHFWETIENVRSRNKDNPLSDIKEALPFWSNPELDKRMKIATADFREAEKLAINEPYKSRIQIIKKTVLDMLTERQKEFIEIANTPIPVLHVKKSSQTFKLDGKVDDEFWKDVPQTKSFVRLNNNAASVKTFAKATRDDKNLYFSFVCEEPKMDKLVLDQKNSCPGLCTDDSVEVMLSSDISKDGYLHAMLSASGLVFCHWPKKHGRLKPLDHLGIKGAARKWKNQWTGELVIPLAVVSDKLPQKGDEWKIGLFRNRCTTKAHPGDLNKDRWITWSPTFIWGFHVPSRFGKLKFEE